MVRSVDYGGMVPKNCDDGVNVGILDNDACALEMMRLLLQRSGSSMHVVWTGMTAQRTLERVTFEQSADSLSKANVLVMNLALNGISGVDVYRQIRCRNASLGIVGVNSYPLDQYRQQLASAGAQGLFSRRDIFSPAFAKAIREVASGKKRADCPGDFLSARESYEHLRIVSEKDERIISKRELNILSMYTKGLTTEENRKISQYFVRNSAFSCSSCFEKIRCEQADRAIRFCQQHHLIQE